MIIPKISSTGESDPKKSSFDALARDCKPTNNINTALIAMVGEFPGEIDVLKEEPFTGSDGSQLNRICAAVRLARYQIYLTYACKAKLPKNNVTKLWTEKGWRHPKWGELQAQLIDELAEFPGQVIMLLGDTPMRLLIDDPKFNSIHKYRGSFYPAEQFPHLKEKLAGKIIGFSFAPSFTMFAGKPIHFYTMIADFTKALKIIDNPDLLKDNTEIIIKPSFEAVMRFYALVKSKDYVSFDIEATPEFITCFSLAVYDEDKIKSMSIPLMNNQGSYWSPEEEVKIWIGLAEILGDENIRKILQNGMFDIMFTLRTMNIRTENFYFDTMLAQHICYTELPKGLDYLTSTYTYYPYYKDEGKLSHLKVIKDWDQYWTYNAKDSAYLLPISEALIKELEEFEATESMEYTMDLHKPLMEMEFNGFLTDQEGITKTKIDYEKKIIELQKQLDELTGKPLNVSSSKQMIAYFYGVCMIKPYVNKKTGNASCDAIALHRIAKKGGKGSSEAKIIIKIRKYQKLVSTYFNISVDADNRLRCNHKISGTVSGRIATEKTYFGTGGNLQNQPYVFKYFLIADPDHFIVEVDLAKAEAHVVAYLSQDQNMIESFTSGIDVHSFNASKIFNVPIEKVIEENKTHDKSDGSLTMRDLGKKVVHACCPGNTEVLTLNGWIKMDKIDLFNKIAIWNPEEEKITFESVIWNSYDYDGYLYQFKCRRAEQVVTPEHNIPYYTTTNKTFMTMSASEAYKRAYFRLPTSGNYSGNEILDINLVRLFVAVQADGNYAYNDRIVFNLKKQRKIIRLVEILNSLNILYTTQTYSNKHVRISFDYQDIFSYYIPDKKFSWRLLELSDKCLDVFLDELPYWDGNSNKRNDSNGVQKRYFSIEKINCSIVSTISHLRNRNGISGIHTAQENKQLCYGVSLSESKLAFMKSNKVITYKGKVYCPTTSTGFFVIRHNGYISITGNSNYAMGPQTFSDNLAKEEIFISQGECKNLLNNYADRFPGLKRWHRSIEEEVQGSRILFNLFNRPRRFLGEMNAALFRNAYSYKPQSTVAELLNKGMIKCANDPRLGKQGFNIQMLTTVHDSFVFQAHKSQLPNLLQILLIIKDHMTYTFTYKGKSFTIGLDAKIGTQWAGNTAEISSFTQEEVDKAIKKIGF